MTFTNNVLPYTMIGTVISIPIATIVMWPPAAPTTPITLSIPMIPSAMTIVMIAARKLSLASILCSLSSSATSLYPIHNKRIPPTKRSAGIVFKASTKRNAITRRKMIAPAVPQKMAFFCK